MALQYSVAVRNAQNDAWESTIGTAPKLRFYSGSAPANCATAASGTLILEMTLPSDWMGASSSGVKTLLGTWSGTASASNTAGYYRIYDSAGTNCHEQGTVSTTGADLNLDNNVINSGQSGSITTFSRTQGNV